MASRREGLKDLPMVLAYGKLPSMRVLHADKGKRIVLSSPAKPNSAWVPILVTEKEIRLIAYEPPKAPAPAKPQRELRTSTRHRSNQVERRGQLVNEIHKLLEQTNIKLGCVATDIMGVSGRAMLEALLGEQNDAKLLADLAKGCMRNKRAELEKALQGKVQAHHRLVLAQLLTDIDLLDERIAELDREIAQRVAPDQEHKALFHRLAGKRGKKRAMVAVAHSTLETAYYVLSRKQPYRDLGGNYFDQRNPAVVLKRLLKRIENLGFQVTVVPLAKAA
jgi:hypothetical protein